jgi:ABC-2 type transport system permease protein
VLHGAGIAAIGAFFAGTGAMAAQMFPTRAGARGAAMALLGAGLLARMVGDGVGALSWLRWLSPFGLLELSQPYAANRWTPVVVLAVAAAAMLAAVPVPAARRDLHGGLLTQAVGRAPRRALLGSVSAFALRRTLRPLAGWSAATGPTTC